MADQQLWRFLLQLVPDIILPVVGKIMGTLLSFTVLRMQLGEPITLSEGTQRFLFYQIRLRNIGFRKALACWPILQSYPKQLDPAFMPQPLTWNNTPSHETSSPFITKDLQPNEEVAFVIVVTSELDSKNGAYLVDIPTARKDGNHYLVGLPSGTHRIKVSVIGDNIFVKPISLRLKLSDADTATWRTLIVRTWTLWDRLIYRKLINET